jgi:hypothetical protein
MNRALSNTRYSVATVPLGQEHVAHPQAGTGNSNDELVHRMRPLGFQLRRAPTEVLSLGTVMRPETLWHLIKRPIETEPKFLCKN